MKEQSDRLAHSAEVGELLLHEILRSRQAHQDCQQHKLDTKRDFGNLELPALEEQRHAAADVQCFNEWE